MKNILTIIGQIITLITLGTIAFAPICLLGLTITVGFWELDCWTPFTTCLYLFLMACVVKKFVGKVLKK